MPIQLDAPRGAAPGAEQQLEIVRNMLERMVAWRLLYPFSAEESRRFNRLAAKEVRLLEVLSARDRPTGVSPSTDR